VNVELWIGLLATLGIGGIIGWVTARRGVPKRSELDALQQKLDAAHAETEEIRTGVGDHFEQSAVLFGRLAQDYRAFIEHFSESAQALGISELRARELLEQASQPLVTHEDAQSNSRAIDADAVATVDAADPVDSTAEVTAVDALDPVNTPPGVDAVADSETIPAVDPVPLQSTATEAGVPATRAGSADDESATPPPAGEVAAGAATPDAVESTVAEVDFARVEEPVQKAS
jgi:uncharacterized membrane-anchored protein YhcB (DUF1043 family)